MIKDFLQNTNDKLEAEKQRQQKLEEQLAHKSLRPRVNRGQKEQKQREMLQKKQIEQQQKEQREMQQKKLMQEEAVAIGIEEEQQRRDQFLQRKSKNVPSASKRDKGGKDRTKKVKKSKDKKHDYDKVTIQKVLLLLVHLLKKFTAFSSSSSTQYTKIWATLINEICAVGLESKYLLKLLSNEMDFKQSFKSVFRSFMAKADVKDPIVNEFWAQTYTLNKSHNNYSTQSDQTLLAAISNPHSYSSRYTTDYEEIEVLGSGGFGRV